MAIKNPQRTFTGRTIDLLNPTVFDIDTTDIFHNLSQICRFGGATKFPYSVGQHTIYVAERVWHLTHDVITVRQALLHDASEAYIGDIVRPLKYIPEMVRYRVLEDLWQSVICTALGVPSAMHPVVKQADDGIITMECAQLFTPVYVPDVYVGGEHAWDLTIRRAVPEFVKECLIECWQHPVDFLGTLASARASGWSAL